MRGSVNGPCSNPEKKRELRVVRIFFLFEIPSCRPRPVSTGWVRFSPVVKFIFKTVLNSLQLRVLTRKTEIFYQDEIRRISKISCQINICRSSWYSSVVFTYTQQYPSGNGVQVPVVRASALIGRPLRGQGWEDIVFNHVTVLSSIQNSVLTTQVRKGCDYYLFIHFCVSWILYDGWTCHHRLQGDTYIPKYKP